MLADLFLNCFFVFLYPLLVLYALHLWNLRSI